MTRFYVRRGGNESNGADFMLDSTANLITGEHDFANVFGPPDSLESDLLLLASSILASDRATPRGLREDLSRRIESRSQ